MPVLMRESGIDDSVVEFWRLWMRALRDTQPRLLAYLSYMAERLLIMHRILKPTGSLYLHCDPTVSHYVKPLLDAIFGHANFRNEIIWRRTVSHNSANRFGPIHDVLLFYARSAAYKHRPVFTPYLKGHVETFFKKRDEHGHYWTNSIHGLGTRGGASGRAWRGYNPTEFGRHWAISRDLVLAFGIDPDLPQHEKLDALYEMGVIDLPSTGLPTYRQYLHKSQGLPLQDIWAFQPHTNGSLYGTDEGIDQDVRWILPRDRKERMGYPTQKPISLLERIIKSSSDRGETVLDPFCGCATTLEAAQRLGRRWIGIDIAIHAVKRVARVRLAERCGLAEGADYTIEGVPRDLEGAQDLWERDKYHFQKWAVEQIDGFVTTKRSADGGIDGRIYFARPDDPDLQSMVIEVKGGRTVNIRDLRALLGVLDNGEALLASLIVLNPLGPTQARNFARFAARAGTLDVLGYEYPRLQVLTVDEILDGRRFNTPSVVGRHEAQPVLPGIPGR